MKIKANLNIDGYEFKVEVGELPHKLSRRLTGTSDEDCDGIFSDVVNSDYGVRKGEPYLGSLTVSFTAYGESKNFTLKPFPPNPTAAQIRDTLRERARVVREWADSLKSKSFTTEWEGEL